MTTRSMPRSRANAAIACVSATSSGSVVTSAASARITRSTFDSRDILVSHERSDDGVLASARADDQDLHALEPTGFVSSPAQTRM